MKKKLVKGLLFCGVGVGIGLMAACSSPNVYDESHKVHVQGVTVNNNIGTSPMIGPATVTLTINGKQVPQFSTVIVKGPISAQTPVTATFGGQYPCQPSGCVVKVSLPSSCYAFSGKIYVNGTLSYNTQWGYFLRNINCTNYAKSKKSHR